MKILYLVWESLGGKHLLNALKKKEYDVILYPFFKEEGIRQNAEFATKLTTKLIAGGYDYVFSFNYFPMVAVSCKACKVTYVSWVYDNPCIELYSETIKFETNRVCMFDSAEYEKFINLGIETVHYLPLASAPDYYMDKINSASGTGRYLCDIAFVGATKKEAIQSKFSRFDSLDDYTKGFLDGLIRSQKSIYGYNFLEESIPTDILANLKKVFPVNADNNCFFTDRWFFTNYYLYELLTGEERSEILTALSELYDVNIYTLQPTPTMPKVRNMGEVNYYDEAPLAYHSAKINLNITLKSIAKGIPLRALDIMGSGGFLLTNYQEDMLKFLTPGDDFIYYDSFESLMDKVDYYLSHDKERSEIAENGYRKICEAHTYEHRVDDLFPVK